MKFLSISLFFFFSSPFWAQQEPLTTQFWNHYSFFNPAMSGVEYKHQASLTYRDQWSGLSGQPQTFFVNYNTLLKGKHGIGINLMADNIGFQRTNLALVNYNYRMNFDEEKQHFLVAGIGIGFGKNILHYSMLTQIYASDSSLIVWESSFPKINLGITYHWKKWMVGLGSTQINGRAGAKGNYTPATHIFGMASYTWDVNSKLAIVPRFIYRSDFNFQSMDLNVLFTYMKKYSLGASFRNSDTFALIAQYDWKEKWRIGYSFEQTTSKLNNGIFRPSHEFVLGFLLK